MYCRLSTKLAQAFRLEEGCGLLGEEVRSLAERAARLLGKRAAACLRGAVASGEEGRSLLTVVVVHRRYGVPPFR